jgi:hypothetical protein
VKIPSCLQTVRVQYQPLGLDGNFGLFFDDFGFFIMMTSKTVFLHFTRHRGDLKKHFSKKFAKTEMSSIFELQDFQELRKSIRNFSETSRVFRNFRNFWNSLGIFQCFWEYLKNLGNMKKPRVLKKYQEF